ncbi:hypothetical protein WMY93_020057 [Mugilogobius chulae]|uniref:Uncharacterized protein n=1 Tax=Mugilogobius chulae TaxID=88201 RepID=A0AAW0NK95_9GOBI
MAIGSAPTPHLPPLHLAAQYALSSGQRTKRAAPISLPSPCRQSDWKKRECAGQPSRSPCNAPEYSSSLGLSPPTLCPGHSPLNKEQVIRKDGGSHHRQEVRGNFLILSAQPLFYKNVIEIVCDNRHSN